MAKEGASKFHLLVLSLKPSIGSMQTVYINDNVEEKLSNAFSII